jgi:cysteine desulfurase
MAIKGVAGYLKTQEGKKHLITTETEHKCVLASARELQAAEGSEWDVTYLPVKKDGLVDLEVFKAAIRPGETKMASVMFLNNEIGVVQPIKEIGKICKENDIIFHTDAAQAIGKNRYWRKGLY